MTRSPSLWVTAALGLALVVMALGLAQRERDLERLAQPATAWGDSSGGSWGRLP